MSTGGLLRLPCGPHVLHACLSGMAPHTGREDSAVRVRNPREVALLLPEAERKAMNNGPAACSYTFEPVFPVSHELIVLRLALCVCGQR